MPFGPLTHGRFSESRPADPRLPTRVQDCQSFNEVATYLDLSQVLPPPRALGSAFGDDRPGAHSVGSAVGPRRGRRHHSGAPLPDSPLRLLLRRVGLRPWRSHVDAQELLLVTGDRDILDPGTELPICTPSRFLGPGQVAGQPLRVKSLALRARRQDRTNKT
jgi:hypothetical protein